MNPPERRTTRVRLGPRIFAWLLGITFLLPAGVASEPAAETLIVDELAVLIDVRDAVAVTRVSLMVTNGGGEAREITLEVPLSANAVLTNFTLATHNKTLVGRVLERAQAGAAYNASKARGEDAVLLNSAGKGRLSLAINVGANRTVRLNGTYAEPLPLTEGTHRYSFPAAVFGVSYGTVRQFRLHADIASDHPWEQLTAAGVPSAPVEHTNRTASWDYMATDFRPATTLTIHMRPGRPDYTSTLVLSGRGDDAAFAMGLLPPGFGAAPIPLDVVFVLDHSGSMSGTKIVQARDALVTILGQLRPQDRFDLVIFDDQIEPYKATLQVVTASSIEAGRTWIRGVEADGYTDIEAGVASALEVLRGAETAALPTVVLITDGLPTSGITSHRDIIASLAAKNPMGARIHVVGIGFDQDDAFLGELASASRGFYQAVAPSESSQAALEGFYRRISTPVLKDVQVGFEGWDVWEVHPAPLPDVYQGSQLLLAGRANGSLLPDPLVVTVAGRDAGGPVSFQVSLPTANSSERSEVLRLWARQKANSLERYILLNEGAINVTAQRVELLNLGLQAQIETLVTSWVIADVEASAPATLPAPQYSTAGGGPPAAGAPPAPPPGAPLPPTGGGPGDASRPQPDIVPPGVSTPGSEGEQTPSTGPMVGLLVLAAVSMVFRRWKSH